jgi:trafficking kinesin-binding protein 2
VIDEVYRVVVGGKKTPNTQDNGKNQEAKASLQEPDFVVYLSPDSNLLGRLRRNQSLSVMMGSFGAPLCTSSPTMGILKED